MNDKIKLFQRGNHKKETCDKRTIMRKTDSFKFQKNSFNWTSKNIGRDAKFSGMPEYDSNEVQKFHMLPKGKNKQSDTTGTRRSSFKKDFIAITIVVIFFTWPMLVVLVIQTAHHKIHLSYSYIMAEGVWLLLIGCFLYSMLCDYYDNDKQRQKREQRYQHIPRNYMETGFDSYKILGLSRNATPQEVKARHKALMRKKENSLNNMLNMAEEDVKRITKIQSDINKARDQILSEKNC